MGRTRSAGIRQPFWENPRAKLLVLLVLVPLACLLILPLWMGTSHDIPVAPVIFYFPGAAIFAGTHPNDLLGALIDFSLMSLTGWAVYVVISICIVVSRGRRLVTRLFVSLIALLILNLGAWYYLALRGSG